MRMAADRRDNQPTGSLFVGEIDHDEIKHIEVYTNCLGLLFINSLTNFN